MSLPATFDRALGTYNRHVDAAQRYYKMAHSAYGYYQNGMELAQRYLGYTVFVEAGDPAFHDLVRWFRDNLPEKRQRVLIASSLDSYDDGWVEGGTNVNVNVAGSFDRVMSVCGHKMRVVLTQGSGGRMGPVIQPGVYFYCRSKAGRQVVIDLIAESANKRYAPPEPGEMITRDPNLYAMNRHGSWDRLSVPWRPVDSVILADGQMERIVGDLAEFIDNERFYVRRSLPYHRGYLFHGVPGTGKTSLVRALAKHFGLDLWTVPLGDIRKDADLVSLVRDINKRAILLLEDVDVYSTVRRKTEKEKVSLSGLLNTIDGVSTPHGLITVLTTNYVDRLDPALLRPGRVDVMEELAPPSGQQLNRLFEYFYEERSHIDFTGLDYPSVAAVTEIFKQHLKEPRLAELALAGYPEAVERVAA